MVNNVENVIQNLEGATKARRKVGIGNDMKARKDQHYQNINILLKNTLHTIGIGSLRYLEQRTRRTAAGRGQADG